MGFCILLVFIQKIKANKDKLDLLTDANNRKNIYIQSFDILEGFKS